MLTSNDFSGLLNERFFRNFVPIPATSRLRLGNPMVEFELPDITNNRQVKLSDYRDKQPVLLDFTRIFTEKQYCPLCYPHIIAMNENYERFTEKGVEVLMITSTDSRQSQQVVKDLGVKMPLLSDPNCRTFKAYEVGQALGAPLSGQFLIDQQGKLRYKHLFSFLSANAEIETLLNRIETIQ
ncbi:MULTISPECIES: peroxiredoxin family protein [unclassified Coleofasciculus]|uniref:peroxiredoxin family protein n=1 Tax=unclassified Coleofasciculus TaxID=2692782 RepID=UPI001880D508|nr:MULTISPECIES: redoxin domain-containing protein [unclassified Coleofasciculus]MBE9127972.1 redoxin domain-containing protein [Coleofasciculus sp. LEGE 07081]MBE9149849.1 redoxin domain-containing protein [Coleofasciculus sp. LEGE 07092]